MFKAPAVAFILFVLSIVLLSEFAFAESEITIKSPVPSVPLVNADKPVPVPETPAIPEIANDGEEEQVVESSGEEPKADMEEEQPVMDHSSEQASDESHKLGNMSKGKGMGMKMGTGPQNASESPGEEGEVEMQEEQAVMDHSSHERGNMGKGKGMGMMGMGKGPKGNKGATAGEMRGRRHGHSKKSMKSMKLKGMKN